MSVLPTVCVSCSLCCAGLAEELGSCSPPGRRLWEEGKMVLQASISASPNKLLLLYNKFPAYELNGYEITDAFC